MANGVEPAASTDMFGTRALTILFTLSWFDAIPGLVKGIETRFLRLFSPCVFGHGDWLRTRDEDGFLTLQCADCGREQRILVQPAIKGPRLYAAPVKGTPQLRARRLESDERRYPRSA